jgi:hypothetical protein
MEPGAIVGIVLGSLALVCIIAFLVYMYWWKPYHNKSTPGIPDRVRLLAEYGFTDGREDMVDGAELTMGY